MSTVRVKWNIDDVLTVTPEEWHEKILKETRKTFLKRMAELEEVIDGYCDDITNRRTFIRDVYRKIDEIRKMVGIEERE